jgi:dTDP-4-dehydrorhamnose reductase
LGEIIALGRDQCDLAQPERLPAIIRSIKPDVIVNAAAYTAVDKAEQEEALAFTINGRSVAVMAEEAQSAGALLVHYSTDYVFDGQKSEPYTEDDAPCPINAYGWSKLSGEVSIREIGGAYVILRTSWIYAARGQNFVRTILKRAPEGEALKIVSDQIGAPTWARDVAESTAFIIQAIVRERAENRFVSGLFNLTASGATSWYGFAKSILDLAKRNGLYRNTLPQLYPICSDEYPLPAARPKNSCLAGDRVRNRFAISVPDWKLGLAHCVAEMQSCTQV